MIVEDKLENLVKDLLTLVEKNKLESFSHDILRIIEINKKLREKNKIISAINYRLRAENGELLLRFDGINIYSLNDDYGLVEGVKRNGENI